MTEQMMEIKETSTIALVCDKLNISQEEANKVIDKYIEDALLCVITASHNDDNYINLVRNFISEEIIKAKQEEAILKVLSVLMMARNIEKDKKINELNYHGVGYGLGFCRGFLSAIAGFVDNEWTKVAVELTKRLRRNDEITLNAFALLLYNTYSLTIILHDEEYKDY